MDGIARKGAADGVCCLWRHPFVRIVESMHRQTDLPKMVGTAHSPSCFSSGLNGWQQKTDERSDDRDRHQKLDQCKASPLVWHLDTQGALIVDCNKRQTTLEGASKEYVPCAPFLRFARPFSRNPLQRHLQLLCKIHRDSKPISHSRIG